MRAACTLAALAALCACGAAAGVRPAPVTVRRCCPPGERLADLAGAELGADEAAAACRPEAEPTPWRPRVYAASLGRFLEPGRLPPHWSERPGAPPECSPLRVLPEHAAAYALRLSNARLLLGGAAARAGGVSPDRYCADARAALVCASDVAWVPSKCCGDALAWDAGAARCVPAPERAAAALAELRALANGSAVGAGWPACALGSRYGVAGALRGARLSADGALRLRAADGESASLAAGSWCAEAEAAPAAEAEARVWACETEARAAAGASGAPVRHALYGAGLAVGALFLLLTLLAGLALPAAHRALHWRCQTHYVAALLLGDVLLAATQLAADRVPPGVCRALAVCMHFLFLSAFFWLNTMCFNIWWTFRDFRPTSLERGQEAWRLRVYVAYAVGGPLLLAGAAAALDRLPAGAAGALPRPRFAERRCWFYGDLEVLVYFFGPVGVLLLVNLALFASTTRQLTCGLWRRDEVKSTSERAALGRVCAKLVVVMGVTWGADVVSWAAGGPAYVWYASDLLNALQGVFIFLVAGCQPPARAALRRAARACCRPRAPAGGATSQLPSCGDSLTHTTPAPAPAAAQAPPAAPRVPMETVC